MKKSKDGKTLLIENPLCGNSSYATALGMEDVKNVPKWVTPEVAREKVKGWKSAFKVVLVRNPVERFESGATLAFSSELDPDAPKAFNELVAGVVTDSEATADKRARALLEYMQGGGEVPLYLQPQGNWLKSMFNTVLATHDIAAWFNVVGKRTCHRSNTIATNPANVGALARINSAETRRMLQEVYADDTALFERLLLWAPVAGEVRLLGGTCASCMKKREEGEPEPELLDLTKPVEVATRKRSRKQIDK